jgi:hypothetical protein
MEVELTRSADDRRRYELAGYGAVRWPRRLSTAGDLLAGDAREFSTSMTGWTQRAAQVTDAAGAAVGAYRSTSWLTHDGAVTWRGVEYEIRRAHRWRNHYSLLHFDRPVLRIEGRGWGRRPATVSGVDPGLERGLVLFAVWLVQTFISQDASSGG